MIKSRSFIAAIAAGTFVLASCSAGATDYVKAAEKAITDSPTFKGATATCEKPASTDVGTKFNCSIKLADGSVQAATATIDKKNHVLVGAPEGTSTIETTPAGGSTVETTAETTASSVGS